jgi:hypothetical protein
MPLACQAYVYPSACSGEQPVTAVLTVSNATAAPIAITGAALSMAQLGDGTSISRAENVLPLGPGMPVIVPAGSTIIVGPFPVVVHSNAGANSFQAVGPSGVLTDPQPSDGRGDQAGNHFPQFVVLVGATVYGSDGSINVAGTSPLLVDVVAPPPLGYQGGFLHLSAPNNLVTYLAGVL